MYILGFRVSGSLVDGVRCDPSSTGGKHAFRSSGSAVATELRICSN